MIKLLLLTIIFITSSAFSADTKIPKMDAYRAVGFAKNVPTMVLLGSRTLEAWNWKTQQPLSTQTINAHDFFENILDQVDVDPTGTYAVLRCDYGCGIYAIYDIKNGTKVFQSGGGGDGFFKNSTSRPIFSSDGSLVTLSMGLEGIVVRSTEDGAIKHKFQDADDNNKWFIDAAFSKDHSRIYTLDRHCRLKERQLIDGKLLHQASIDACSRIVLSSEETVLSITKHAALEIDFNKKIIVRDAKLNGTTMAFTYSELQNRLFTFTKIQNLANNETIEIHSLRSKENTSTRLLDLSAKGAPAGFSGSDGKVYAVSENDGFIFTPL